jgi:F1F0 ATPase subunit 2
MIRIAALFGPIGLVLGLGYFAALAHSVRLHLAGDARPSAVAFHLARVASTVAAWVALVHAGGATGTLAALMGFLVARPIATRTRRIA